MAIKVDPRPFGVVIVDKDFYEQIAVEFEDIPQLIKDLQEVMDRES